MSCPFGYGRTNEEEVISSSPATTSTPTIPTDPSTSSSSSSTTTTTTDIPPVSDAGVYYGDYLGLDKLLSAQHPLSKERGKEAHDELLFIIVHQVYELWFKQILHELDSVIGIFQQDSIPEQDLGTVVHRLGRIEEIQRILIAQISVLETMHPLDFLEFRQYLTPASGFQSYQFRVLENKLGMQRNLRYELQKTAYLGYFKKDHQGILLESESCSLFSLVEKWLERTPFLEMEGWTFLTQYREAVEKTISDDKERIIRDSHSTQTHKDLQTLMIDQTRQQFDSLFDEEKHNQLVAQGLRRISFRALQAALMISLYRDEPILSTPFRCLTSLLQIDENISLWRFRHTQMVHRMLGSKIGTGGSSGYSYLKSTTSDRYKIFLDLYNLSSFLIPRSALPPLPQEARSKLGFYFSK